MASSACEASRTASTSKPARRSAIAKASRVRRSSSMRRTRERRINGESIIAREDEKGWHRRLSSSRRRWRQPRPAEILPRRVVRAAGIRRDRTGRQAEPAGATGGTARRTPGPPAGEQGLVEQAADSVSWDAIGRSARSEVRSWPAPPSAAVVAARSAAVRRPGGQREHRGEAWRA
jgi:hypothetical protein